MVSLLTNWKLILAGAAVLLIVLAGFYIKALQAEKKTLVAEKTVLSAQLQVSNASITALELAIKDQNAAVEKLRLAAEARQKANAEELKKAQAVAKTFKDKADQLIKTPRPEGVAVCTAADALIDQEIQNGKK